MRIDWDVKTLEDSLFLIPLLPLLGAAALGLFGRRLRRPDVHLIACGTVATAAILVALILLPMAFPVLFGSGPVVSISGALGTWFSAGGISVAASFFVDHLNAVLALVVTGVGLLIHVYSTEYMAEDKDYARYFAYLNLFVGFMLILVLANDLVLMFVGWEGVGLCSYLLIGFWYDDDAKALAGRKAFVVNRVGDFGFLIGLFTLLALFGTTSIQPLGAGSDSLAGAVRALGPERLGAAVPGPLAALGLTYGEAITLACLCLFLGATGKSAQFPLYVWLPDAMAGPTPVSALIHAATMVTAGVYMIARLSFLFALSTTAMAVIAAVGAFTALFAALMGFAQNDIKKVLAYSTVSQLGFMVLAVGVGAWWQAIFHLVTHAFFKACLFLGAGSVILACHHEQDIRKMGGLRKRMKSTSATFLIATLAITGVAPLSGFFSKDAILHFAHAAAPTGLAGVAQVAYFVGSLAALGTAFYMFRLYFLVFEGEPRSEQAAHATERGPAVTVPLWTLGVLSIVALVWGWPWAPFGMMTRSGSREPLFQNFTSPVFRLANRILGVDPAAAHEGLLGAMAIALVVAWAGLGAAWFLYRRDGIAKLAPLLQRRLGRWVHAAVANKFFVDEIYYGAIVLPLRAIATVAFHLVDRKAIDGFLVHGPVRVTGWASRAIRYLQNGDLQRYAAVMAIGAVATLAVAAGVWTDLFRLFGGD
ncbi:MAG: NADH-quinone oxidoreductase subunit L [Myxococcales bacterium]|jgi:NADH-quinone oxidoreductase subunit L